MSHTTDDMVFQWDPHVPLVVDENIELPQLQLVSNKTEDCSQVYSTGKCTSVIASYLSSAMRILPANRRIVLFQSLPGFWHRHFMYTHVFWIPLIVDRSEPAKIHKCSRRRTADGER